MTRFGPRGAVLIGAIALMLAGGWKVGRLVFEGAAVERASVGAFKGAIKLGDRGQDGYQLIDGLTGSDESTAHQRPTSKELQQVIKISNSKNGDNLYDASSHFSTDKTRNGVASPPDPTAEHSGDSNDAWDELLILTNKAFRTIASYESAVPNSATGIGISRPETTIDAALQQLELSQWGLRWGSTADETAIRIASQTSDVLSCLFSLSRRPSALLHRSYVNSYRRLSALIHNYFAIN